MPKLKSHRGTAKRFKRTASGRFKHRQSYRSHILTKKSAKRKRHLRPDTLVATSDTAQINQMLPYV